MIVMSPPAHNNILLGTAPCGSLFWCDFANKPIAKPAVKPAPKPAPKGEHLQLFKMRRKVGKFYSTADWQSGPPEVAEICLHNVF